MLRRSLGRLEPTSSAGVVLAGRGDGVQCDGFSNVRGDESYARGALPAVRQAPGAGAGGVSGVRGCVAGAGEAGDGSGICGWCGG